MMPAGGPMRVEVEVNAPFALVEDVGGLQSAAVVRLN
jgi:hypothetical protein